MDNEPILTSTAIAAVVSALLAALVAFGVPLTEAQRNAVKDLVLVSFPIVAFLIAGIYARSKVTPTAKIDQVPAAKVALEQAEAARL